MRFLFIAGLVLVFSPVANGQPTARELITKFEKAIRAEKTSESVPYLAKARSAYFTYSLVDGRLQGKVTYLNETLMGYTNNADKMRKETVMLIGIVPFRYTEAVDGESGWSQMNDSKPVVMSKGLLRARKARDTQIDIVLGLESFDPNTWELSKPVSAEVRLQEAWEFEARAKELEPITLSFAKGSGLLLRLKAKAVDYDLMAGAAEEAKVKSFSREAHFYDWKKAGSRLFPGMVDIFQDGVLWKKTEFVDLSFPKAHDAKLFVMPQEKK